MTDDSPSPIDDLLDVLDLRDVGTAHIAVTDVAGDDAAAVHSFALAEKSAATRRAKR